MPSTCSCGLTFVTHFGRPYCAHCDRGCAKSLAGGCVRCRRVIPPRARSQA